jgi:hypothetical protein
MTPSIKKISTIAFIVIFALVVGIMFGALFVPSRDLQVPKTLGEENVMDTWWPFQSIDTMKYSRDLAREKLMDFGFDKVIDQQIKEIQEMGATHVSIATPYDEEFLPFLKRWVEAARRYNLKVWFRGNWSGWENWFGYSSITRAEHIEKSVKFIRDNPSLFQDGDYFTSCPECENGQRSDPRIYGGLEEYRKFLIDSHKAMNDAFRIINRNVSTDVYSMNGDMVRFVMDKETTARMGNFVTADHYIPDPQQYRADVKDFARRSGGKVILGEIGAPIPDLHGTMSEDEQAKWIEDTFTVLQEMPEVYGVNYWVSHGGSTELFSNGRPRKAVGVIKKFFRPSTVEAQVLNQYGAPVAGATVSNGFHTVTTSVSGHFRLPIVAGGTLRIQKGLEEKKMPMKDIQSIIKMPVRYNDIFAEFLDWMAMMF